MKALLQLQLSNYDTQGRFILEADSGYQMVLGRARELLRLDPELCIDIVGPERFQLITQPEDINPDVFATMRVRYVETYVIPNAPLTRYDFNADHVALRLNLKAHRTDASLRYAFCYVNDPMLLRHYRAAFHLYAGYMPRFACHSHFVDSPSNPKFPQDVSLWLGQCEAALKADFNFWQCQSALDEFEVEMRKWFKDEHVDAVMAKSEPWDDGYSIEEMELPVNMSNVRFDVEAFKERCRGKRVIFVPNRIGDNVRTSDYTQCGRFMFDVLPQLHHFVDDLVVIAGNPNQKILNDELTERCGRYGYVSLVPDAFNRDEYRWLARFLSETNELALGWYTKDTFGGTASRELLNMGMVPAWVDAFEYRRIADNVRGSFHDVDKHLCKPDFSDAVEVLARTLNLTDAERAKMAQAYRSVVRLKSSFEQTTPKAYAKIKEICR